MYATPVVYPLSLVPDRFKMLAAINPMVPIIELFKKAFLGAGTVDLKYMGISVVVTLVVLFSGVIVFNRMEKNFMDTV